MSDAVFLCPEVQSSSPAVAVAPPEFFSNKPGLVRYTVRVLNLSSLQQRPAASITVSCALTGQRAVVTARAVAGECPPGECPQFWTSRRPVPVYSAPIHPDSPSQYSGWCCPEGAALKVLPLAGRWGRLGELQSAWLTPPPPFLLCPSGQRGAVGIHQQLAGSYQILLFTLFAVLGSTAVTYLGKRPSSVSH